ncbi:hypothetical protein PBI_MIMI_238 [Arthrobacter phage Mimi]|nr:hypothetical protein PBI_MIMI_32 [Arthrobacter phage Mimi]
MRTIEFNDIQVGDKIRQSRTTKEGAVATCTLTVETKLGTEVRGQGLKIAKTSQINIYKDIKLELLERPEPKEYIVVRVEGDGRLILASTDILTLSEAQTKITEFTNMPGFFGRKYAAKRLTDVPPPAPWF